MKRFWTVLLLAALTLAACTIQPITAEPDVAPPEAGAQVGETPAANIEAVVGVWAFGADNDAAVQELALNSNGSYEMIRQETMSAQDSDRIGGNFTVDAGEMRMFGIAGPCIDTDPALYHVFVVQPEATAQPEAGAAALRFKMVQDICTARSNLLDGATLTRVEE